jgi:hypothetical protein
MKRTAGCSHALVRAGLGALLTTLAQASVASHVTGQPSDTVIGVFDSTYVVNGSRYDSLDALRTAVRASLPASVKIVACGPSAARSWLTAVPLFEDVPMHLDGPNGTSPACAAAIPARDATGTLEVDAAVSSYWNARMP